MSDLVNSIIKTSEMDSAAGHEKLKGVVKWFNDAKGFGFIEHGSGKDVFVHYSVILQEGFKTLEDGEEVEYEVQEGPKGLHAVRVSRTLKPEAAQNLKAALASTEQAPLQESGSQSQEN